MSPYEYPEDEFDVGEDGGPAPVGVHRAPVPAWRGWLPLLVVLVLAPLLAWGAVSLLGRTSSSSTDAATSQSTATAAQESTAQSTATSTEAAGAAPTTEASTAAAADLTTGVTVLNGTSTTGLATRTGERLQTAGFTAVSIPSGAYSLASPTTTTIYYASADNLPAAQAAGTTLGITNLVESAAEAESNPIVIVLRSDFQE